ncbi:MAG: type VI secretion system membrane subunit TssM [Pseudomonadota bacterium]
MRIIRAIFSGIGITVMVALAFSALIWFLGAFLALGDWRPFESTMGVLVGLAVLWILALLVILLILLTAGKRDEKLTEDIVEMAEPVETDDEIVSEELGEMRGKLKAAMTKLRRSKRGRNHLYQLPWYIIIGPPGAGKTTAIVNSGLQFPLADGEDATSIAGVGGTRNCDWWFTDDAVLVDTAGRYTTQESDAEADNAAWLGFLKLLKKHRKRQPINGAIVAISLSDLSMQDEESQKGHATAVRRRLHELRENLGVHFPVYILFTKADLLAGFAEFFEGLGKEERNQVWGFTLPFSKKGTKARVLEAFETEFSLLLDQLNGQLLEKVQTETDPARRSMIATFPNQVASVRQVAHDFLEALFQDNKYEHRQMLRGVYFTSGTQEGTPIDRLMLGMARTFGIGRQALGTGRGTGRSFFLYDLFASVIFPEAGLVSADDKVERRYRWSKRAAFAAVILAALGMGWVWGQSYLGNTQLLATTEEGIETYREEAALIAPSPVGDTDFLSLVPALNTLRDLPNNPANPIRVSGTPEGLGWGLYQGRELANQQRLTYRSALNTHFLPRLLLRLENQMQSSINEPDVLYETLKVYLTLGQVGPLNPGLVSAWFEQDWEAAFPDIAREKLRADLAGHLEVLMSAPMQPVSLNNDLVAAVQEVLTRMPLAERVYDGIIKSAVARDLPEFRLTDVGGPAIARAFSRSSGANLNDGVPGIYTYDGFHGTFLQQALTVSAQLQNESWILGEAGAQEQSQEALIRLSRDVLGLYYSDFVLQYDRLLGDLDVIPMTDLAAAVEVTNVLSGATSPVINVLEAVSDETRLAEERGTLAGAAAEEGGGAAAALATGRLSPTSRLFLEAMMKAEAAETGRAPEPPGTFVDKHFDWLHRLTEEPEGQPSQLDALIDQLKEVYQELSNLNFAGGVGNPQDNSTALPRFQAAVGRIEEGPLKRWASQITVGSSGVATEGTRAGIDQRWKQDVLPMCERVTTNTYPFKRRANTDAPLIEFAELFRPGGKIDEFFNQNLAKFVDQTKRPWTFKQVNQTDLGISDAVLKQFENARLIQQAFFAGSPALNVQFQLTPEALDPKAQQVILEIDGQQVSFAHSDGTPRPTAVRWPGAVGATRITFAPTRPGSESGIQYTGSWAWFRMLDAAEVRNTNVPDRKRVIFNIGGRIAIFQMQSGASLNPFTLRALGAFSCPKSF